MTATHNKLKTILFSLTPDAGGTGTPVNFECQLSQWQVQNNTDDPEQRYTFCPDGEFYEDADPSYALSLTFYSDWKADGISDFLWQHHGEVVDFTLDHLPDVADQHVQWTGTCRIKSPNAGGEVRSTESQEVTLAILGTPTYVPNADVTAP